MQTVTCLRVGFLAGILSLVTTSTPSWAQPPLEYHGGRFLENFEIYPLFYGKWTDAEVDLLQAYVDGLAAYMSGKNAPDLQQPVIRQYGIDKVTAAKGQAYKPDAVPGENNVLSTGDLFNIINEAIIAGKLPAWAPNRLLLLFAGAGFTGHGGGCGDGYSCHNSDAVGNPFAVVPHDAGPAINEGAKIPELPLTTVGHEVFEASAAPALAVWRGWDETSDGCGEANGFSPIHLPAFNKPSAGLTDFLVGPIHDNTQGGDCSLTGYTSIEEGQDYQLTHDGFVDTLSNREKHGWNLYILQTYVLPGGDVRYDAIWRRGTTSDKVLLNETAETCSSALSANETAGYRLYIYQRYVLPNGDQRCTQVWRPGSGPELPVFEETLSQFLNEYKTISPEKERRYIFEGYATGTGELLYDSIWHVGVLDENADTEVPFAQFSLTDGLLHKQGWRLYSVQPFVAPGGEVFYNAIWRPGTHDEQAMYAMTLTEYQGQYGKLYKEGWRLYILVPYVLRGGQLRYDAVWRRGTINRPL